MALNEIEIQICIDPLIPRLFLLAVNNPQLTNYLRFLKSEKKLFQSTHNEKFGLQLHLTDEALNAYYKFMGV